MSETDSARHLPSPVQTLTRREREVLALIGRGLTLPEIAERLHRSQKTIESHRLSLGRKLGATNRVELARIAITAGLAPLDREPSDQEHALLPQLRRNLARHYEAWKALRDIDAALASATGFTYFRRLVTRLPRELGVRAALVAELAPEPAASIRMLLLSDHGELVDCEPTSLKGTPCQIAVEQGMARFDDVPSHFPPHPLLDFLQVRSYLGVRLSNSHNQPIGVLALLHDGPIDPARQPETVLRLCASRAAAELERTRMEEQLRLMSESLERTIEQRTGALRQANARLQRRLEELNQAQAQLRTSERRFRTLVETMSDGLAVMGTDGRLCYVNERFCRMLGRSADDLIGRDPTEFFVDPGQAHWFRDRQPQREADRLQEYEVEARRADGTTIRLRVAPRTLYDEAGRYAGSFGVLTDVAERKESR